MVRYVGFYSNVCQGKRKKQESGQYGYVIEQDDDNRRRSKSWARLIKKICEADPLTCPKCKGSMRIIAFIEDYKVIKKILDCLGIDEFRRDRPPPKTLAAAGLFNDYAQNDYTDSNYTGF